MPFAEHNGVRLRYEVSGSGPPVILHHGGMMRLESWDLFGYRDRLADHHTVIAFDARGHGESDKPTEPEAYSMDAMVGDVIAVLDAAGVDSAHYLGFSMGAKVGWGMAATAQDRVRSLVIGAADPYASDESAGPMIEVVGRGMEALVEAITSMWVLPEGLREHLEENEPAALLGYFRSDWPELSDITREIAVPCLIYVGTEDPVVEGCRRAATEISGAELVEVLGADHLGVFTRPEEVLNRIVDFLDRSASSEN